MTEYRLFLLYLSFLLSLFLSVCVHVISLLWCRHWQDFCYSTELIVGLQMIIGKALVGSTGSDSHALTTCVQGRAGCTTLRGRWPMWQDCLRLSSKLHSRRDVARALNNTISYEADCVCSSLHIGFSWVFYWTLSIKLYLPLRVSFISCSTEHSASNCISHLESALYRVLLNTQHQIVSPT
jgi:hypothetical protein